MLELIKMLIITFPFLLLLVIVVGSAIVLYNNRKLEKTNPEELWYTPEYKAERDRIAAERDEKMQELYKKLHATINK